MGTNTKAKALETRAKVSELLLYGHNQIEIAKLLGINQSTVARHKAALEQAWEDSYLPALNRIKIQKLAELAKIRVKLWDALNSFEGDVEALKKVTDNLLKAISQESAMLGLGNVECKNTDIDPELYMQAYQVVEDYKKLKSQGKA